MRNFAASARDFPRPAIATVETIAARRLIDLGRLVEVLRWTRHATEAAEELWVDVPMLLALHPGP